MLFFGCCRIMYVSSNTAGTGAFAIEDVVKFIGNAQYTTKSCNARITKISKCKTRPYHVVGTGVCG